MAAESELRNLAITESHFTHAPTTDKPAELRAPSTTTYNRKARAPGKPTKPRKPYPDFSVAAHPAGYWSTRSSRSTPFLPTFSGNFALEHESATVVSTVNHPLRRVKPAP